MPVFSAVSLEFTEQRVNIFGFRGRLAGNGGRGKARRRLARGASERVAVAMLATIAREQFVIPGWSA
jgi:hypothetical protein